MAEPDFKQESPLHTVHFGLSESISEAVSDYYALLFDNVQEFISHNEEGLKEYEQENAELAAKLAEGGLDQSGEQAIRNTMRINTERIGEIHDFLNSDMVNKVGIDFSVDILGDSEPELMDRFNAAPVTEKYACLVKHYMEKYRADVEARGEHAEVGSLVEIDAFRFAVEKTKDFFPKIAEQYSDHKQAEYKELLETDPVRLYSDLIVEYSTAHVADMGEQLLKLQRDHDIRQSQLQEHDATKPGWLKNASTLGHAGKTWEAGREVLARRLSGVKEHIEEVQKSREECREGWLSETARREAKQKILSRHPEVVDACEQHMARHWKESNAARLEQQKERLAERETGNEQSSDKGFSR